MGHFVEKDFILCTGDEFELPLMIGTYRQIAAYTGYKTSWLKWAMCRKSGYVGGMAGKDAYRIIPFPEEELEEENGI